MGNRFEWWVKGRGMNKGEIGVVGMMGNGFKIWWLIKEGLDEWWMWRGRKGLKVV